MVGMGSRTIKTAIGASLAIWLAGLLQLEFSVFAAIIVIMCVERTKKRTVQTILDKFFACLLSLFLSGVAFEIFGYSPVVIGFFILLFVPLLVKWKIQNGFVTSMVVVTHLYTLRDFSLEIILSELLIIIIGIGIAFIINNIMPSFKKEIETYKDQIEEKFSMILSMFAVYLRGHQQTCDSQEIVLAEDLIKKAKEMVIQDIENHLIKNHRQDYFYLEMREDQFIILKRMLPVVSSLGQNLKQKEYIADLLEYLSQNVNEKNTTHISFGKVKESWKLIKKTDLPKTRDEFETRANLFYLMKEIENYLQIKRQLYSKS
ncbi:aromatic acid exporter family protein [Bacillus sp. FJAT-50079]|uniref:aromatic acid exporter family protein n=1 Tax=Bacillus sp. FJAT-50079 TaxID=2833577 RepID=UPI001BC8FE73|nr:aromatic acid exporter family protein [Bacillus sp. FJAT-50079]MBS4209549.1 aromatic acid exporter family protein [Bacillus sp. FJAT-50079]